MSTFMDNKQQLIHYASEILVLTGLVVYFSKKNKTMMTHIEDMLQRLEEQEETIQKHEKLIKGLSEKVKMLTINALQKQEKLNNPQTAPHIIITEQDVQKVEKKSVPSPSFQCKIETESDENINTVPPPKKVNNNLKNKKYTSSPEQNGRNSNLQFHILDFTIGGNGNRVQQNKCELKKNEKIVEIYDDEDNNNLSNLNDLDNGDNTDEEIQEELDELANENSITVPVD